MKFIYAIPLLILSACSGTKQRSQEITPETTVTANHMDSIGSVSEKPIEAISEPVETSIDKSFTSADEAYDEGYYNGQQEGYTDATHHLDFGYSYNDEPEYSGFLKAYMDGYEDGYIDGYHEGEEWSSNNE